MARLPAWHHDLGAFQSLYLVAFAFYALTLIRLPHYVALPRVGAAVFVVALAARAALLPTPPSLSDDLYRYAWEGKVLLHGGNPYRQSPLDPGLAPLREARIFPNVNHPELTTIYPPLAEAGFALVAAISPTLAGFKAWVLLHDLALVALLVALLGRRGRSGAFAAVYAWNPLVLVEYAGSGHNDPTAMAWLLLALLAMESRPLLSAAALVTAVLVKLAPLLVLPFLWRGWPWRARGLALAGLALGLGWFLAQTHGESSGLLVYWRTWRNNDLLFAGFQRLTGSLTGARLLAAGLVGGVMGLAWAGHWGTERAARAGFKAAFLAGPVAHPWYQGWYLMLEPLAPSAPWILLSATAILSYGRFATPPEGRNFHLPLAWRLVEYGAPALLAAGIALVRRIRARPEFRSTSAA